MPVAGRGLACFQALLAYLSASLPTNLHSSLRVLQQGIVSMLRQEVLTLWRPVACPTPLAFMAHAHHTIQRALPRLPLSTLLRASFSCITVRLPLFLVFMLCWRLPSALGLLLPG